MNINGSAIKASVDKFIKYLNSELESLGFVGGASVCVLGKAISINILVAEVKKDATKDGC